MVLANEQMQEMLEAAKPLMRWIDQNCHIHHSVVVDAIGVKLLEEIAFDRDPGRSLYPPRETAGSEFVTRLYSEHTKEV